jgi:hypothetical protein
MTDQRPVTPAPAPLEEYAHQFDECFSRLNQRNCFRRYLEGLLLPTMRNKSLTGLANTEPGIGAQHPHAQALQRFLSESPWLERALQQRRLQLLLDNPLTAPTAEGVLSIDEHGDHKAGRKTAHVGRQHFSNLGKIDKGVVSVTSLWADEGMYYPLDFEPFTPSDRFARGKRDPAFRTEQQLALELVQRAIQAGFSFRAVVANSFFGEDWSLRHGLRNLEIGYILALKPSHSWSHPEGSIGSLEEAIREAGWQDAHCPGKWVKIIRYFRNVSPEEWWMLEVVAGPYGPHRRQRAVVATTDPETLPPASTLYLVTNLPHPQHARGPFGDLAPATLEEIAWLYGFQIWIEQSYDSIKALLGWSEYQVRSDLAIRRHWQLVCCAFCFCWHHQSAPSQSSGQAAVPALLTPASPGGEKKGEQDGRAAGRVLTTDSAHAPGGAPDVAAKVVVSQIQNDPTAPQFLPF